MATLPRVDLDNDRCLWLFSSNRRALYAQDVSNVAALPAGARCRFRYRRLWVGARARAAWESERLVGSDAVIVFSFQHDARIHPPAFIPVRVARVVGSEILGSFFVVDFEVGDYVTLKPHPRGGQGESRSLGQRVQEFSRAVEGALKDGRPGGDPEQDKSAVLGPSPAEFVDRNPPLDDLWERIIEHLSASGAFSGHLFFRMASLTEADGTEMALKDGRYELTAGKTYELLIAHYQPEPLEQRRELTVAVDETALAVHGQRSLPVMSGYDSVRVRFHANYRDEPIDTTLAVEPSPGETGARVGLSIRISPPKGEKAFRIGVGAFAVLVVAVPGAWNDFSGNALVAALTLIATGALGTAWLSSRSRIRLPNK